MFKKLAEHIRRLAGNGIAFDPASLGDPLALQTSWNPAKRGGASFRTHKLVTVDPNRLEFRTSLGAILFYFVFLLVGLGLAIGFSVSRISSGGFSLDMATIMPVAIGVVFACAGGWMLYAGTQPIVFDKTKGCFWKGRKSPDEVFDKQELKHYAELHRIHALQLVSEYCRGNKNSYYSYEMNIVLDDGKRINVVDHGNRHKLREDADTLGGFLGKPVWDAIH